MENVRLVKVRILGGVDRVDHIAPSLIAFEAAARHVAGEDTVARAQIVECAGRLRDAVKDYLEGRPERLEGTGIALVAAALAEA